MKFIFNFEKTYFWSFLIIFIALSLSKISSFIAGDEYYYSFPYFSSAVLALVATFIIKFLTRKLPEREGVQNAPYNKIAIAGFCISLFLYFIGFIILFFSLNFVYIHEYFGYFIFAAMLTIFLGIIFLVLIQIQRKNQNGKYFAMLSIIIALLTALTAFVPLWQMIERQETQIFEPRETVMTEGMRISANTAAGSITIEAGKGFDRTYTWGTCTRSLALLPRSERWNGSYGIYNPGAGNHWKDCMGISRAVVEEGQQNFDNMDKVLDFLSGRAKNSVYTNDGLVVSWGLAPERGQLNVDVWQILINGNMPTQLPGSKDDAIMVTQN